MPEFSRQLLEIASWQVAAEIARRQPRLRVIETHSGGGQYDCLDLILRPDLGSASPRISLNRMGGVHILTGGPGDAEWPRFWDEYLATTDPRELITRLCTMAGFPATPTLPATTPPVLTYRLIAALLAAQGHEEWECRSGFFDSSGADSSVREVWFAAFPAAKARLAVREEDDLLGQPAYRFWFLSDGRPRLCLETTGLAWDEQGNEVDLMKLYRESHHLPPLVERVAHLLPTDHALPRKEKRRSRVSLAELADTALPLNRKERYYTGTVFPMIVGTQGFRDLGALAALIPGCELPVIDPDPRTTNLQFFTEYSLKESIFDAETRARFPHPPATKDTPDIVILVRGDETVLIALEAKMYDQPAAASLVAQMQAQRVQLDYLEETLALDRVHHVALLPQTYAKKLQVQLSALPPQDFTILTWEQLLAAYRPLRTPDDYFMGVLELALLRWPSLCTKPSVYRTNAELLLTGAQIVARKDDPAVRIVGRKGGLWGPAFAEDVTSGAWRRHVYEVSAAEEDLAGNHNWFSLEAFLIKVEGH